MKSNIWLVRPMPHGTNHMKDFLDQEIIAVGYPVGKNLSMLSYGQLRSILDQFGWVKGLGNVNSLANLMDIGDIVVVPDDNEKDVYFCEITSDYIYNKQLDEDKEGSGFPHQRKVKWFFDKKPFLRFELSEDLRSSLRYPGTVADISKHYKSIMELLDPNHKISSVEDSLEEAAREVLREMLKSDKPEYRLRAAEIILKTN